MRFTRPRVIPCLLLHNKGLVKTRRFRDPVYLGDPINVVYRVRNDRRFSSTRAMATDTCPGVWPGVGTNLTSAVTA